MLNIITYFVSLSSLEKTKKNLAISSERLREELSNYDNNPSLVFDLRDKDTFEKSHIRGSVHVVCDASAKKNMMPAIPKKFKIVLVSDPENISRDTSQMMTEYGLDSHYLEGGFSSWTGDVDSGITGKTISPDLLHSKLDGNDDVFILDVRNSDEFSEFQIKGSINIPLGELFESDIVQKIPKNKPIVTVCPKGNRAMVANFVLEKQGISAQTLEGGLSGWNQVLVPVTISDKPTHIIQVQKIGKGCLSHIVESEGQAIVIDPLYPVQKYLDIAKENGFTIIHVFDTHQHADHISGVRELAKLANAKGHFSKYEGYDFDTDFVGNDDAISFGRSSLRVIHTPGHTPGSLSYLVDEKYVFTGDILFVESIGRPDLRDKAEEFTEELYDTLHNKLLQLPDKTMIFPTHQSKKAKPVNNAYYSTISQSKKLPWLDIPKQEFVNKVLDITVPRPMNYQKIINVNKGALELVSSEIPDMEIGPNRCAVDVS